MATASPRETVRALLAEAVAGLAGEWGFAAPAQVAMKRTKRPEHGDFASNVAMTLTKVAGKPPLAIADAIIERLARLPAGRGALVAEATVAGPGFINLRLSPSFWQGTLARLGGLETAGTRRLARHAPTGPMHGATLLRRHVRRLEESARCTRRATWRARWRRWRPRASSIATTTPSGSGRTALWNDDKDRVVMKSDGLPTYLLWVDAVAQVTCNALRLLGVSAPEQMTRLEENITKEDD